MRVTGLFLPLLLFAQPLPLSVQYDPFDSVIQREKKHPFTNSLPVEKKRKIWRLMAIYDGRALINGQFVQVGEKVGDFVVKKIENGRVVLEKKGEKKILCFASPVVRMERR